MDYDYLPDRWVVVKITTATTRLYKVFGTWTGGYGRSDSWRMNSGIIMARNIDAHWEFIGDSGSIYACSETSYGTTFYGDSILQQFIKDAPTENAQIEIMPEDTDWSTLDYNRLQQFIADGVK